MIDLELANVRHGIFVLRLELLVNGIEDVAYDPEIIGDATVCDLGRWLGDVRWLMAERPEYAQLVEAHQVFHRYAGDIVRRHNSGDHAGAKELLDEELEKSSLSIYVAIDRLKAAQRSERKAQTAQGLPAHRWLDALASGNITSLMTGIAVLDAQHREIAALLGQVLAEPARRAKESEVWDNLTKLGELTKQHFATEEQIMRHAGLPEPELALHQEEHDQLLRHFDGLLAECGEQTVVRDISVCYLAEQWVLDHIRVHDLKLARHERVAQMFNPGGIAPLPS